MGLVVGADGGVLRVAEVGVAADEGEGRPLPIRDIHARAKQHLHRGRGDLSLDEPEKKRRRLERCLRACSKTTVTLTSRRRGRAPVAGA